MADFLSGLSGSNRGFSGFISGMDTESMVEKMLANTKNKIAQQQAAKQQLLWKQAAYRETISTLNTFKNSFFSYTSPKTNLLSTGFYRTMSASYSSSAVKVTATSDAQSGKFTIDNIKQIATASKLESGSAVTGTLEGDIDLSAFADGKMQTIGINVDGISREINLSTKAVGGAAEGSIEAFTKNLENELKRVHGSAVQATVTEKTPGSGKFSLSLSTAASEGRQVTVETVKGSPNGLESIGMVEGQSNKLNRGVKLKDLNLGIPLSGDTYQFQINGVNIEATAEDTLADVISRVNSSEAGVTMSYNSITDKFTLEAQTTGKDMDITIGQTYGNLMTSLFGAGNPQGVVGNKLQFNDLTGSNAVDDTELGNLSTGVFQLTVNNKKVSITLPEKKDADGNVIKYTAESAVEEINKSLLTAFGADKTGKANIELSLSADGTSTSIRSNDGYIAEFTGVDIEASPFAKHLGFTSGQTQGITKDTLMSEFGGSLSSGTLSIGGINFDLSSYADKSITDFTAGLQAALRATGGGNASATVVFDDISGRMSIAGVQDALTISGNDPQGTDALSQLFGSETLSLGSAPGDSSFTLSAGKDAVLSVNGVEITRSTNSFSVDGMKLELVSATDTAVEVNTTRDTEQIYKGIESFVTEYNKMIEGLNKQLHADTEYKKYPPLTDEQKKEMTEKEIEQWEEKGKEGLIRGDNNVSSILSNMRLALYDKPEDAKFALYQIGITTSGDSKDYGKLIITDPDALKAAIATDAEEVSKLFTSKGDAEGKGAGLAQRFNTIINDATKPSTGSLSAIAGLKTSSVNDQSTVMGKQLKAYDTQMENLKRKYDSEYSRYWKQFNSMEKMISQLNSQSAWLSQQFA